MRPAAKALTLALLVLMPADAAELEYKDRLLESLVQKVPGILDSFDPKSGRFGTGIWTCRDQHPMYPLAVAYATPAHRNRYYQDPDLLDVTIQYIQSKAGCP